MVNVRGIAIRRVVFGCAVSITLAPACHRAADDQEPRGCSARSISGRGAASVGSPPSASPRAIPAAYKGKSLTFACADASGAWVIDARGDLDHPEAVLVHVDAGHHHEEVARWAGYAFSPQPSRDFIFVVVDHAIARVEKRPPHRVEQIATDQSWPFALAADEGGVVWSNKPTDRMVGGRPKVRGPGNIVRARLDGSQAEEIVHEGTHELVMNASTVFYKPQGENQIRAVPRTGGRPSTLVAGVQNISDLTLDGPWLVFARDQGVSRVRSADGHLEKLVDGIAIPLHVAAEKGVVFVAANSVMAGTGTPAGLLELRVNDGGDVATKWLWSGSRKLIGALAVGPTNVYVVERPWEGGAEELLRVARAP